MGAAVAANVAVAERGVRERETERERECQVQNLKHNFELQKWKAKRRRGEVRWREVLSTTYERAATTTTRNGYSDRGEGRARGTKSETRPGQGSQASAAASAHTQILCIRCFM